MEFIIALMVVTGMLVEIHGKTLSSEYQVFNNSSRFPTQPGQPKYSIEYKEIILYLTPSQIRALQQGQGFVYPPQPPHADTDKHTQAYVHTHPQAYHQNGQVYLHLPPSQPLKTPSTQETQSDPFVPTISSPNYRQSESDAYNDFQAQNPKRILKPIPFFPDPYKEITRNEPKALSALIPQEKENSFQGKESDDQITRQQLKEQWLDLLNQNIAHFTALKALSQVQTEKSNENKDFHYSSQNNDRYKQRLASDVYNLARSNKKHQFKQQQAILQGEVNVNKPSMFNPKDIKIKHPAHVIAPVPDFKVPHAYPVPFEILGTVPVPIKKIQTNDFDRPVPSEVEKHIPLPATKNVYVDNPFYGDQTVFHENPAPNRGRLPIHNHEWHH